jgi:hypothetical protein
MSILFALMVRLWAAIILSLVGVALVAAPIGAVQVEGRKPSTTTRVAGRKAPTLSSFRRARKARRVRVVEHRLAAAQEQQAQFQQQLAIAQQGMAANQYQNELLIALVQALNAARSASR